ncbi:hypothetical protein [Nocardia jinanensis]|uniref:Uncharacterized protein n=1 Tax=Nocardia jinanensis TaxID=382504 RepID=A0A917VNV5_9NOCA|nr:hypothetical protein [Nocardia jinanensis]GGL03952.1 hypothetical protein GCM10011588_18240 [Nocardia jinanensis]
MTASHLAAPRDAVRAAAVVDIAGSRWPVYKLEALIAGLLVFLVPALVLGSVQTGVLLGAAVGALLWTAGRWRAAQR